MNKTNELLNVLTSVGNQKKSKRYLIYIYIYNRSLQLIPIGLIEIARTSIAQGQEGSAILVETY